MKSPFLEKLAVSNCETTELNDIQQDIDNFGEIEVNTLLALRIRRYMLDNGLSQKELADKLCVTPQYVNKLLRGKVPSFSVATAVKYGKLLGIRLVDVCPKESIELRIKYIVKPVYQCKLTTKDTSIASYMETNQSNSNFYFNEIRNERIQTNIN